MSPGAAGAAEVVERKGAGHLNAICDAPAEPPSRDLCGAYREQFGTLLHHNIEKALLSAVRSAPAFGGRQMESPIKIDRTVARSGR